jgi:hypothetical protein
MLAFLLQICFVLILAVILTNLSCCLLLCAVGGGEELCHFLLQSCFCTPHTDLLSVVHLAILSCFFHCDFGDEEEHSWVLLVSLYTILVF